MFRKLLDLLLPVPCPCCGGVLASTAISHICESCQKSLEIINSMGCSYCGRPIKSGVFCRRCKGRSTPLDGFYITGIYEGKMRELIINFKFNDARYLTKTLAELAVETIVSAGISDDYYLIPVPLHPKRERERGYNQSALLVKHIAHLTGMRADYRLIKRRKNTIPQTSLGKKERSLNLKGAFTASKRAVGRKIVILDDVATTGVTLRLCAHALINQGASEVIALALAHGR